MISWFYNVLYSFGVILWVHKFGWEDTNSIFRTWKIWSLFLNHLSSCNNISLYSTGEFLLCCSIAVKRHYFESHTKVEEWIQSTLHYYAVIISISELSLCFQIVLTLLNNASTFQREMCLHEYGTREHLRWIFAYFIVDFEKKSNKMFSALVPKITR